MAEADAPVRSPLRRVVAAAGIALFVFVILWWLIFSAVTAALISAGVGVFLWIVPTASDAIEAVFDAIGAVLGAVAAFFVAILSIFS